MKRIICLGIVLVLLASNQLSLAAGGRRLVSSDVVRIKVVNQPDLDNEIRIEPDGTISFPYAGRIRAAGLTEDELAARIKSALEGGGIVKTAQVLVSVSSFGAQVSVLGAVTTPGVFPLDRPTTLNQVLSRAGGLSPGAGSTVVIRRPSGKGTQITRLDAKAAISGKTNEGNTYVQNNDEIYIEDANVYYLYGYVNKPGQYTMARRMTVQQALAAGGGRSELGSDWRINIKRRLPDGKIVESPVSLDDDVEPNDVIVVNERFF